MCGIAGYVETNGDLDPAIISKQLELLDHRGPDSSGFFTGRRAVIGQTRLAIIDLETGDPPISDETGAIGVALNGEVYNYRELREDLLGAGHKLRTRGDTEVIAHLAETLGPTAIAEALEGMFAFAMWDDTRERLVLGRDRLGKKPLYYWWDDGRFVFATEIKALLAHPHVPRDLDDDAIGAYLTFGYVPTPRTFFKGILSLPPGHVLSFTPGGEPELTSYWQPRIPGSSEVDAVDMPFEFVVAEVRRLLAEAVSRRLVADVPVGAFLSGGIDSSSVVALMAGLQEGAVPTFTIGFEDDDGFDERPFARIVADRFATDHTEFVVKPDAVNLIERLVWHHDQPFGDSSAIPTFLLSELTRAHVKVALCGDGGDELFAGYERFAAALLGERYARLPGPVRRGAEVVTAALPVRAFGGRAGGAHRFVQRAATGLPDSFRSWLSYATDEQRRDLTGTESSWAVDYYRRLWDESEGADTLDRLLVLNLRTYLLDDLLVKVDRMSMAHGLEVRSPLLDRELLEFSLRLPRHTRIKRLTLKRALKAAVADLLPPEILHRRKRGFAVPLDRWLRTELSSYLRAMLTGPRSRVHGHLDGDAVEGLVAEHLGGTTSHGHALWALLTLEVFLRREGW